MALLCRFVLLLKLVKLPIFTSIFVLNKGCVSDSDVVIGTFGDLSTQVLESLSGETKLSHVADLELFGLFLHFFKENR